MPLLPFYATNVVLSSIYCSNAIYADCVVVVTKCNHFPWHQISKPKPWTMNRNDLDKVSTAENSTQVPANIDKCKPFSSLSLRLFRQKPLNILHIRKILVFLNCGKDKYLGKIAIQIEKIPLTAAFFYVEWRILYLAVLLDGT